jgi:hypothetical protein
MSAFMQIIDRHGKERTQGVGSELSQWSSITLEEDIVTHLRIRHFALYVVSLTSGPSPVGYPHSLLPLLYSLKQGIRYVGNRQILHHHGELRGDCLEDYDLIDLCLAKDRRK